MEFLYAVFKDFWLGLGDWNQIDDATLSQVMRPSNEMFNLHDNVTVQFYHRLSNADYRFYMQNTEAVGVRNYQGNVALYVVCEQTNATEALVNGKTLIGSPPSFDAANYVCFYNLVEIGELACKQK